MSTKDEKLKQLKLITNSWIKSFTDLPNDVKEVLASYITSWNNSKDITIEKNLNIVIDSGSVKIHKHGSTKQHRLVIECLDCKKTFSNCTGTVFERLRKTHRFKYQMFLECHLKKLTLKETGMICGINLKTKLLFEDIKLLDFIKSKQKESDVSSGIIELDEIYFLDVKKGRHKNGIGRAARKRGKSLYYNSKRGINSDLDCVSTMVDRNGESQISYLGKGKTFCRKTIFLLLNTKLKILNLQKFITDGETSYKPFINKIGASHYIVGASKKKSFVYKENSDKTKSVREKLHIQNVNNFHRKIKELIENVYNGVSSKNLDKYINWVKWTRINKGNHYSMMINFK
ncbi:IS1595 family transposase [Mycoplasma sp. 6243]|uniref:IS1595 family transposase n=1 Tax=Mycoplasma sp. 6243 TaxID=3440865 RepID=UPI003EBD56E5